MKLLILSYSRGKFAVFVNFHMKLLILSYSREKFAVFANFRMKIGDFHAAICGG